jgi:hypothetical protein
MIAYSGVCVVLLRLNMVAYILVCFSRQRSREAVTTTGIVLFRILRLRRHLELRQCLLFFFFFVCSLMQGKGIRPYHRPQICRIVVVNSFDIRQSPPPPLELINVEHWPSSSVVKPGSVGFKNGRHGK